MSEYTKQAEEFLKSHDLEFSTVLVGQDCPRFCEDAAKENSTQRKTEYRVGQFPRKTHIHGNHYRCTIKGKDRGEVSFDFWNSYADEEHNAKRRMQYSGYESVADQIKRTKEPIKTPQAYDLLACITKNDPGTFKDFCADFGYSDDSIKAFDVYRAVQDEYSKVRRFFTAEEMEQLQEIS